LGISPDDAFVQHLTEYSTRMNPGDLILQYTDGLNEATNELGEQMRFEGILRVCDEYAAQGAKALVCKLVEAERQFRGKLHQKDDITLLAMSASIKSKAETVHAGI
jgi:sigma-B regulation protein RsbU (phosphoserine phosphatase)